MNQHRRNLTAFGLGMMLAPLQGITYAANKVYRIAWPTTGTQVQSSNGISAFKKSLRKFGYIEGQNMAFDVRYFDNDLNKLPGFAAEIVAQKPDVIVASTNVMILALQRETKTIPIVMTFVSDPVNSGFAASLAHPGGNITGLASLGSDTDGKKLELIRLIAPGTTRVGVLMPNDSSQQERLDAIRATAKAVGLAVHAELVLSADDLAKAISTLVKQKLSAVIVFGGSPLNSVKKELAMLATRSRMFTVSPTRNYVEAGGLLSYGPNTMQQTELSAGYVDKILKGAKPGDLPIQQPIKFELIINGKTAKTLGITLSQELLLRADEVIE